MSGGGSSGSTTVKNEVDPSIKPFLTYGLNEARRLYQTGQPQYFPGQTFVGMSSPTAQALNATQQRAMMGSPLNQAAQATTFDTVSGNYLGGNPFFQGAFDAATRSAQDAFERGTQNLRSTASRRGRYGSGALQQMQDRLDSTFAGALTDTAGKLAYSNFANERNRQMAAAQLAPRLAATDYGDIDKLMRVGQIGEGYQEAALADAIARFNFQQQQPQQSLVNYLNMVYGAPQGSQTTQPIFRNRLGNTLGGALGGYALGSGIGSGYGKQGAALGALTGLLGA